MKINWFSPLPPAKTGIAEYSRHVLAALSQRAEVAIWTDQSHWDPELEQFGKIRRFRKKPDWRELNRADATFYNIGNNVEFHASIWQTSRSHAGIAILHDTHLQHLFVGLFKHILAKPGVYRSLMAAHHGPAGGEAADLFLTGRLPMARLAEEFPLTSLALENTLAAVVHVPTEVEPLARHSRRPVTYAPLPYAADARAHDAAAPDDANHANANHPNGPPYRLIVFGYLGPNRRLDAILQALETFPQREQFRLNVYGRLDKSSDWPAETQRRGLSQLVTFHGYVSDNELDRALASSHLAINLRYPSMGEASWTQLRLWNHALPSLVTQTGWYATLPEEAVCFVRPDHEVADLQGHWERFLGHPAAFSRKGAAGYGILRDLHAPEKYAETLLDAADQAQHFRGRATAMQLVERTGGILSEWAPEEKHASLLDRIAREIRRLAA